MSISKAKWLTISTLDTQVIVVIKNHWNGEQKYPPFFFFVQFLPTYNFHEKKQLKLLNVVCLSFP